MLAVCVVRRYRNMFTVVPRQKMKEVAAMLKTIHAQEDQEAARPVEPGGGLRRSGRARSLPNFSKDSHSWDCRTPLRGARNDDA